MGTSATNHKGWNLLFHGVGAPRREMEPGEDALWITADTLAAILDVVAERPVGLSVDDGNTSDVDLVLPALVRRGLTATFFILSGRLGQRGSVSAAGVRELRDAGMRIGTHGLDHIPWRGLSSGQAHREHVQARERLEEVIQEPVTVAACPLGRYDRRVLGRLRRLGYEHVYTSDGWPATHGAWLQPRYSVRGDDTAEGLQGRLDGHRTVRSRAVATAKATVKRLR